MQSSPRSGKLLIYPGLLLIVLFLTDVSLGSVPIPFSDIVSVLFDHGGDPTASDIVWQFRMPKAITCVLAGASLACTGLMMQSLFRNPLAGPDVLGLSSGASLLVALVILAGASGSSFLNSLSVNPWSIVIAASLGSALVFLVIMSLARKVNDNAGLLIVGLMISSATAAVVSVLQFMSPADDLQTFMVWMMGSVGGTGWRELKVMAIVLGAGLFLALFLMKPLNGLLLGENYARSIGINLKQSRFLIVLSASLMAGTVTAFCGPIAFVGLAVPHLVRSWIPTRDHKMALPAVMLTGAGLLLFCDILAQLPGNTQVLPINAITSLIGAPVVIWVVMRSRTIRI